jgi:osmotically-inducible protein OsmY
MILPRKIILLLALSVTTALSGCVVLLGSALVGGAMVASDRRSSGTQLDDQKIELESAKRAKALIGTTGRVSAVSFNRVVLLVGDVANEADKAAIESDVTKLDNVRSVVNELNVAPSPPRGSGPSDTFITTKAKATLVNAGDVPIQAFKVVTQRAVVYLMGRVTQREADRATSLIRTIEGVSKVVKVVEIISQEELDALMPRRSEKTTSNDGEQSK